MFFILLRACFGLLVLALIAFAFLYMFLSRSVPNYNETVALSAISSQVKIVRNNVNIPHILAEEDTDILFGLGYAHA